MKLIRVIKKSYVQKKKIKEAMNKAIDYYGKSRNGTAKLWGALYEDRSVGK